MQKVGLRLLIFLMVLSLIPTPSSAQFLTKSQAIQAIQKKESKAVDSFLSQANDRRESALRKLQAVFTDIDNHKVSVGEGQREADTIIANFKADLQDILNDYVASSKTPGAIQSAKDTSQEMLDQLRQTTRDELDGRRATAQANPNQLTGKYFDYQQKVKAKVDEIIAQADQRLADSGSRSHVVADLNNISQDATHNIELMTKAYLVNHPTLTPSVVNKVQVQELDRLKQELAKRYKAADQIPNDKFLDLKPDEQKSIEELRQELDGIVQRTVTTVDAILRQTAQASSNLPTGSNISGVNPYLEAKIQAEKQVKDLQQQAVDRLATIRERIETSKKSDKYKTVAKQDVQKAQDRVNDTITEYNGYFSAGDPTAAAYEHAKHDAQEEAKGCTSFFCSLGRVAAGVGAVVLGKETKGASAKAGITGQTISGGLFGIKDAHYVPGAYSGYGGSTTLPYVNGQYVSAGGPNADAPIVYGRGYNPCYGMTTEPNRPGFVLVEKAQAADSKDAIRAKIQADQDEVNQLTSDPGWQSNSTTKARVDALTAEILKLGASLNGSSSGGSILDRFTGYFKGKEGQAAAYGILGNLLNRNNTNNQLPGNSVCAGGVLSAGTAGGIYPSPFSGSALPIGQLIAGTDNLRLNPQNDNLKSLAFIFGILASKDPDYNQAVDMVKDGQLSARELTSLRSLLERKNFYQMNSDNPRLRDSVVEMLTNACAQMAVVVEPAARAAILAACREIWIKATATTPGISPGSSTTTTGGLTTAELASISSDIDTLGTIYGSMKYANCQNKATFQGDIGKIQIHFDGLTPRIGTFNRETGAKYIDFQRALQTVKDYNCSDQKPANPAVGVNQYQATYSMITEFYSKKIAEANQKETSSCIYQQTVTLIASQLTTAKEGAEATLAEIKKTDPFARSGDGPLLNRMLVEITNLEGQIVSYNTTSACVKAKSITQQPTTGQTTTAGFESCATRSTTPGQAAVTTVEIQKQPTDLGSYIVTLIPTFDPTHQYRCKVDSSQKISLQVVSGDYSIYYKYLVSTDGAYDTLKGSLLTGSACSITVPETPANVGECRDFKRDAVKIKAIDVSSIRVPNVFP